MTDLNLRTTILPSAYSQLEYIETTSNTYTEGAYIDTGFAPDNNTKVECVATWYDTSLGSNPTLYGCRSGSGSFYEVLAGPSSTPHTILYYQYRGTSPTTAFTDFGVKHKFTTDVNKFYIDDVLKITATAGTFTNTQTLTLFCLNNSGNKERFVNAKMYSCKIWDNGTLVRDFVPAKRKIDQVVGMYDLVNEVFYTSATSTALIAGPVILTVPEIQIQTDEDKEFLQSYEQVEYIESHGTEYIETNINASSLYRFDMSFTPTEALNYGVYLAGATNGNFTVATRGTTITTAYVRYHEDKTADCTNISATNINRLLVDENNDIICNDTKFGSTSGLPLCTLSEHIVLFNSGSRPSNTKLYGVKLYGANNVLVADLIPARRKSDNVLGMWDKVSKTFFTNKGTGTFNAGEVVKVGDVQSLELPNENWEELEYIESTGTQYINTGLSMPNGFRATGTYEITQLDSTGGIIGTYTNPAPHKRNFYDYTHDSGNRWLVGYGGDAYQYFGGAVANTKYTFDISNILNNEHLITNGTTYTVTPTGTKGEKTSFNLYLFALNVNNVANNFAKMKLYCIQVYNENNTLVRDFIPARNKQTQEVGLFDSVNQKFYTNAGTGTFTAGNVVGPLHMNCWTKAKEIPSIYTKKNYLESTSGGNQYIDLNYVPTMQTGVKATVEHTALTADQYFIGSRDTTGNTRFWLGIAGSKLRGAIGNWGDSGISAEVNKKYLFTFNMNGDKKEGLDNQFVDIPNLIEFEPVRPWYLFVPNNNGTVSYGSVCKMYDCKIYEGTNLVFDLVPVVRNSDNKPGMYDKITDTFFTNASTSGSDFTAG